MVCSLSRKKNGENDLNRSVFSIEIVFTNKNDRVREGEIKKKILREERKQ